MALSLSAYLRKKEPLIKKTNGIIIYEDLTEIVDPRHSCLIVWDVQNGLVDRIFNKEEFYRQPESLKKEPPGYDAHRLHSDNSCPERIPVVLVFL